MLAADHRLTGGEHEQLGIEPLQRLLELLLRADPDDDLDRRPELDVLVARAHDARVARRARGSQDRQLLAARIASTCSSASSASAPPASACRASFGPVDGDDQRDPVALGDGLAQTSGAGHATAILPMWLRFSRGACAWRSSFPRGAIHRRFRSRAATILGTDRADFLVGRDGSDRIVARAGDDRISADTTAASTGSPAGRDATRRGRRPRPRRSDCEVVSTALTVTGNRMRTVSTRRRSSRTPTPSATTTVAVFQNGRNRTGGAASIAFSTSRDGGRTWREGILPGLTPNSAPPGRRRGRAIPRRIPPPARRLAGEHPGHRAGSTRFDDPPLDRRPRPGVPSRRRARAPAFDIAYDKNWLACDNAATSPSTAVATSRTRWSARSRATTAWRCSTRTTAAHLVGGDDDSHPSDGRDPSHPGRMEQSCSSSGRSGPRMVAVRSTDGGVTLGSR